MPAGDGDGDDGDGDGDADGEDGNAAARDGHSGGDPGTEYSHTPIEATEGGEPPCPGRGEPDPNSTNPFVCNGEFCTHIPVTSEDRGDYTALRVQFGHTGCICKMPGAQWDAYNGELWQRAQKRRYRGQDGVPDPRRADQDELRYTLYYYASTGLYAVTGPCRMTMPRCLRRPEFLNIIQKQKRAFFLDSPPRRPRRPLYNVPTMCGTAYALYFFFLLFSSRC